ncbi:MAG: ATP-binding cassette domain-containing protein [Candidatus Latescibacteria bacterium]|nr:ATP-binding cassette domain-containing protein [Candidatus Latescibacterota bacterium]
MPAPVIHIQNLSKTFKVPVREAGVKAAIRSLFKREHRDVKAVEAVSFDVSPGEIVGFLGPNGAGKTTTLKMLSGLLHPSGGTATVLGHTPFQREKDYLRQITLVMGQRNQLVWDIPVVDSFERNRAIYRMDAGEYHKMLDEMTNLLDLGDLLQKPTRNLSLGERMKCEIAVSLLHKPQVLFLDEPTIGLDVTMQRRIRSFIQEYNRRTGATVLLTSHYMADVEALCKRVIIIHHGKILFDGDLSELVHQFSAYKTITIDLEKMEGIDFTRFGEVVETEGLQVKIRVPKTDTPGITGKILSELTIQDLTVEDPPIEEFIDRVFSQTGIEPETE